MALSRYPLYSAAIAALLSAGSAVPAHANYIITLASDGGGPGAYTYTYDVSVDADQRLDGVGTAGANPSFFSILDWGTYSSISESGDMASDFTFSNPLVSPPAFDQAPADSPFIGNVQANFMGTATIGPSTALGTFTLTTNLAPDLHTVYYEAEATKAVGLSEGDQSGNTTATEAPNAVPEPGSLTLSGAGLVFLGGIIMRRRRRT